MFELVLCKPSWGPHEASSEAPEALEAPNNLIINYSFVTYVILVIGTPFLKLILSTDRDEPKKMPSRKSFPYFSAFQEDG